MRSLISSIGIRAAKYLQVSTQCHDPFALNSAKDEGISRKGLLNPPKARRFKLAVGHSDVSPGNTYRGTGVNHQR